ncbi:Mitochondrial import inner membrane translocase subunit [Lachnellula hyalina]|uniref:Mitochondrial import inner membrane translocase subunit TIM54 n=1 Tax=Lachnellula hyalina TaxID=1316788 RepID=A0A8H8QZL3_9HELO|nr:Mitochondrial import inner membrane translocase subunit [Lachnellula hyalina]TVY25817.1 Mitochondrial import inner membrane translocase subunit [Lachnellula hyalina]
MADSKPSAENGTSAPKSEPKPDVKLPKASKPNPMWKYLGFGENFRPKLPSRNWSIFLAVTGSFTAAVIYDKRETKRVQRKWCRLVEHVGKDPLDPRAMPRKLSVFLEGPPTDGLRSAQDHFKEYVKPVLVASGLDWEFIQGRKEGDIRAELAEKIRKSRLPLEQRVEEDVILEMRTKTGIAEFEGPGGDIVIGRHTWKEYVRGLHEGWLGPLKEPPKPEEEKPQDAPSASNQTSTEIPPTETTTEGTTVFSTENSPQAEPEPEPAKEDEKPKKPPQPAPFISTLAYPSAPTPPNLPTEFDPSTPISFPHILGFLNTPRRLYRFLNRRFLADDIGRDTAAIILSNYRPYKPASLKSSDDSAAESASSEAPLDDGEWGSRTEQATALQEEEKEWHKSVRVHTENEPERTWLEPVVLDPRIASRMRRFELSAEDEERARSIVVPENEIEGFIKGGLRSLGKEVWRWTGIGIEKKPFANVGDPDVDSQG